VEASAAMQHSMRYIPELRVRFSVQNDELSSLHARAFGSPTTEVTPWASRLSRHSLTWIGAFDGPTLIGFVHACWDGGLHAFLLDTVVDPAYQRRGVGRTLVQALIQEVKDSGCEWVHVDYEPHLTDFYTRGCGFRTTPAGVIHLL
jgi:GNAT superfamily N-acetyltransferase